MKHWLIIGFFTVLISTPASARRIDVSKINSFYGGPDPILKSLAASNVDKIKKKKKKRKRFKKHRSFQKYGKKRYHRKKHHRYQRYGYIKQKDKRKNSRKIQPRYRINITHN